MGFNREWHAVIRTIGSYGDSLDLGVVFFYRMHQYARPVNDLIKCRSRKVWLFVCFEKALFPTFDCRVAGINAPEVDHHHRGYDLDWDRWLRMTCYEFDVDRVEVYWCALMRHRPKPSIVRL